MTSSAPITASSADRDAGPVSCVALSSEDAMHQAGESPATSPNRTPSPGQQAVGEDGSGRAAEHPAAKDEHDHASQDGAGGPASRTSGASHHTETHRRCAGEGEPPASPAPVKRQRREPRVFDADGREVFITQICTKCARSKPLRAFGLRLMPDGKVRSIPQCRACRGGEPRDRRQVPLFPRRRRASVA